MTYMEFLRAARKHRDTCIIICEYLDSLDLNEPDNQERIKKQCLNLYYLAGYVIECSVKYAIYASLKYNKKDKVTKLSVTFDNELVTYKSRIENHRFIKYVDLLNKLHGGIILLDRKTNITTDVTELYDNWNVEIRYWCNDIPLHMIKRVEVEHVQSFYHYANKVLTYIQRNIRAN